MGNKIARGAASQAASTILYKTGITTSSSYADVEFTLNASTTLTEIDVSFGVSLEVEAKATTQDVKIKILTRAHSNAEWRELEGEADVTTSTVASVYSGAVRGAQVKIQVKEGSSSGGTLYVAVTVK